MKRGMELLVALILVLELEAQDRRRTVIVTPAPAEPVVAEVAAGESLAALTPAERASFNAGRAEFLEVETVQSGLGPVFNDRSCVACHLAPAPGGGSNRLVTRFGRTTDGAFDPMTAFGGSLIQERGIRQQDGSTHNFMPERVPQQATIVANRRTQPLFGLGLVDATPDTEFITLAAIQFARNTATAGRVHMVDNLAAGTRTVGKFGWKAQQPTLLQFAGDAYLNEMGITTPRFPSENCPQGNCAELSFNPAPGINEPDEAATQALRDFMAFLAPPPRGPQNADTAAGETIFHALGCADCHVATLVTGASSVAALDRQTYHPYSDFLLHDMGGLGDGIVQGDAGGSELRTAPLWGLRFIQRFLHDGRATTIEQAIEAHDGQGRTARDRFSALDTEARARLLAFLRSL